MWESYAEGHPLRKDFPLRGHFSRAEQVRRALSLKPEEHYSAEELELTAKRLRHRATGRVSSPKGGRA